MVGSMKILWCPTREDRFLTYGGAAINLFQVERLHEHDTPRGVRLSDDTYAVQLASNAEVQFMKCVAWYPGTVPDSLIAVGQANGRIVLSNFGQKAKDPSPDLVGKEFIPKHARQCVYLSWNGTDTNLLAEGLDKHRDSCILIWDIMAKVNSDLPVASERQRYSSSLSDTNAVTKPYIEIGPNETTSSLSWFNKTKTFVTGMNGKFLRVYDLRDTTKPHLFTHTKFVQGVCTDYHHDSRVASFSESQVAVWDVRSFDKPVITLPETRPVLRIDWCPTRMGFLSTLCKDSSVVKLYDIKHSVIGTDELDPVIIERNVQPNRQNAVSYFHWHPSHENRLLTITPTGTVKDNQIFERMPLTMSPGMSLTWACGKKIVNFKLALDDVDISVKMRDRALKGYGLHVENVMGNADVVASESYLHGLWDWLASSRSMFTGDINAGKGRASGSKKYIGIKGLLQVQNEDGVSPSSSRSDPVLTSWRYPEGTGGNSPERGNVCQYRSDARIQALQLCGWGNDRNARESVLRLLHRLQEIHEYERAAAIALFTLQIGKSVDILSASKRHSTGGSSLSAIAMALSGFTEEKNALWRKTCTELRQNLTHPYLRAMFAFLSSDKTNYHQVLDDQNSMAVKDRVAFACIYLPDSKLWEYLEGLSQIMIKTGDLDGLLLTGMGPEGIQLLERYVDQTGDVQTASLAAVYTFPNDISKDERVRTWIESYRNLLDRWRLWHQRAKFDIIQHAIDPHARVANQAYISCNFCGKSIACNMTLASRTRPINSMLPLTHKPKITCCPGCRKPLPRCALCLTNLGTPAGSALYQQKDKSDLDEKLSPISSWFTWCQSCRHGGHATHITEWFHTHSECPVTACNCKCMSIDPTGQLSAHPTDVIRPDST